MEDFSKRSWGSSKKRKIIIPKSSSKSNTKYSKNNQNNFKIKSKIPGNLKQND